jgi:uncharacterized membrane protein YidH (DUF202 family)
MARVIGMLLIIGGILGLVYGGFTYNQTHKDVSLGSLEVTHNSRQSVWVPPLVSGICLVGGLVLFATSFTRRSRME